MLKQTCGCAMEGRQVEQTAYGRLFKRALPRRQSETWGNVQQVTGRIVSQGYLQFHAPKLIITPDTNYKGDFPYSELPQLPRIPPWKKFGVI